MRNINGFLPLNLDEALLLLKHSVKNGRVVKIVAGGTDVMARANGNPTFFKDSVLDISALKEIQEIKTCDDKIKIGAGCTHAQIAVNPILKNHASILTKASSVVGSPQIRHRGTIGGNICNASPVGDILPSLYVLNAVLTLASASQKREVPIKEFIKAPGRTVIQPDEILTEITVDMLGENEFSDFRRSATRKALAISKSSVAFRAIKKEGTLVGLKIALGSVGPTIVLAHNCEKLIEGKKIDEELLSQIPSAVQADCKPIDDLRSTKEYRSHVVAVFLAEILRAC